MAYNTIHPSDSERTQRRKKEEEKLCINCRVYTCICFTIMMLVYVIIGIIIYMSEDFDYNYPDALAGSS